MVDSDFRLNFDLLDRMRELGGYYECQYDATGKPLGPLVGYAGRYETDKQYVGTAYFNFAAFEQSPSDLCMLAEDFSQSLMGNGQEIDCILAMPMGGLSFSLSLCMAIGCNYAFAEKKILELATPTFREQSRLVLARHTLPKGEQVAIGEDVVNNFSTTAEAVELVKDAGAEVVAIVCAINRSDKTEWNGIPVISHVHRPTPQYRQDDPMVADLVKAGNVVWKPKNEWPRLMAAMQHK